MNAINYRNSQKNNKKNIDYREGDFRLAADKLKERLLIERLENKQVHNSDYWSDIDAD